ncbi:hypothetical protein [Dactylosporangium sp. NPDC005555]|uniref:SCO0607 family lipoprotein n=1 Tax=Dactylosporangium sp. NPDC005555 TaxID=3154889 RepID=UPI0033A10F23
MPRLLTLLLLTAFLTAGCSFKERICGSGEHPVKAVGNTTGRACVPDGTGPPAGYAPYPSGKVPKYIDDEWDRYWRDKIVDEQGNITSG